MSTLTTATEQYKAALLANPNACPHCGSDELTAGAFQEDYLQTECDNCGCTWQEIYKLTDIDKIEIPS